MTTLAKTSSWSIAPSSMGELMQFAKLVAESELVPKDYRNKPGNVVIAIQMGSDVGLTPMQAIQAIAVINGRATLWGDTMLAVVLASPLCKDVIEMSEADIRKQGFAKCIAQRVGREDKTSTFSIEDAKTAGLWGKQGPWTTAPARMLKMRARAFALRDQFSDVLRGIASAEEQADIVEARVVGMSDTPVTDAVQRASDLANPEPKQLPPPATNFAVYWFKGNKHTGKPLSELEDQSLTNYIGRLEKCLTDERWAEQAKPYHEAACAELDRRMQQKADAAAAGADPETGEVPAHQLEAEDQARADRQHELYGEEGDAHPGDAA